MGDPDLGTSVRPSGSAHERLVITRPIMVEYIFLVSVRTDRTGKQTGSMQSLVPKLKMTCNILDLVTESVHGE